MMNIHLKIHAKTIIRLRRGDYKLEYTKNDMENFVKDYKVYWIRSSYGPITY